MEEYTEYNKQLCEERHSRIDERLRVADKKLDDLERCAIKLTQIVEMQTEQLSETQKRVEELAARPSNAVWRVIFLILSALAGAICAGIVDYFGGL